MIEETIALFEPRYGRPISSEEARQIMLRLTGFFQLLVEWDRRERQQQDNDLAA